MTSYRIALLAGALLFGMAGTSRHAWVRVLNRVYVEFFRGNATLIDRQWRRDVNLVVLGKHYGQSGGKADGCN